MREPRATFDATHQAPQSGSRPVTRLYVVRHGEVDDAWRDRLYGRLDVPLSLRGLEQSERIAAALARVPLAAVVSSGLARAEAAALRVRATRPGLARRDEPDLIELDRGPWAGRSKAELRAADPEGLARWEASRGVHGAAGAEPIGALVARAVPAFARLAAEFPGQAVAVIAHLWIARAAAAEALGLGPERIASLAIPPGGFVVLDWPVRGLEGSRGGAAGRPELVALGPADPVPGFGGA